MDTLGNITPGPCGPAVETDQRVEVLERLHYLARRRQNGLLVGESGLGKSWLMSRLSQQLRRAAWNVAALDLQGVSALELPGLISARLGSGLEPTADALRVWAWLQDFGESVRSYPRRLVFLLDHAERAEPSVAAPLGRIMGMFGESSSWLFATRPVATGPLHTLLQGSIWLRVQLESFSRTEVSRVLAEELASRYSGCHLTPAAVDAAWEVSQGQMRRLRHLAELASLAAEAEGLNEITGDMMRDAAHELV